MLHMFLEIYHINKINRLVKYIIWVLKLIKINRFIEGTNSAIEI